MPSNRAYFISSKSAWGGSPSAFDRVLGLKLGAFAANKLIDGCTLEMVGVEGERLVSHPLSYVLSTMREVDPRKLELADVMSLA